MKSLLRLLSILFLATGSISCRRELQQPQEPSYTIGFSQCTNDLWRQIMMIQMEAEATKYPNMNLIILDALNDNEKQISQIEELVKSQVDLLIISPNESSPITPAAVQAYRSGIPTIIWDRKIDSDEFTTFISADNYAIGRDVGRYVLSKLPEGSSILEITGLRGSSPAKERHDGFMDTINGHYRVKSIAGDWQGAVAGARVEDIPSYSDIDLMFGHNDDMAIAAYEAVATRSSEDADRIKFIGIDAIVGVDAVIDGRLDASFLYPPGGEFVIETAMRILNGESVEKNHTLKSAIVDSTNAATLKQQSEQILNYQNHINAQRKSLDEISESYKLLRSSSIALICGAFVLICIAVAAFHVTSKTRKQYKELQKKNAEIEKNTEDLLVKNAQIENLSNQKLQFFTNLSHEIRTPLTLILNPLDKMAKNEKDPAIKDDIWTLQHNARHLLKIVNQILDFRKIENNKTILSVQEVDIVPFVNEVLKYFEAYSQNEKIIYKFHSSVDSAKLFLDRDKIEQVLINLISNAFKNSKRYGIITVSITDDADRVTLEVHDTGKGIDINTQRHIFDRFYTLGEGQSHGIGLHLSREYVEMHKGRIHVESEPGKFTSFYVEIPKGRDHLPKETVFVTEDPAATDIFPVGTRSIDSMLEKKIECTVLIAEDDEDIRAYLERELSENFNVIATSNGYEAMQRILGEEVDVVLSDVLMPHINGFQLCREIKTNLATSHIPVILLTALTDDSQRIYGIAEGADEYIRKPFNIDYLKVKIMKIHEDRLQMKETFFKEFNAQKLFKSGIRDIPCADDLFKDRLTDYLENHFDNAEIGINDIGLAVNLSRAQLYRKTIALFGVSPTVLLRRFRLSKSADYLSSGKYTISEVAYMTGFSAPSYFTRCFKEQFGISPTEYKNTKDDEIQP